MIDCSKVCVKKTPQKGLSAFAKVTIQEGDLIEKGVIRRIDIDGNQNQYLFTWSEDKSVWGFGSGCATFYNTSLEPNTHMIRNYDEDTFEIYALQDILIGEELTHKYKSLEWRKCFQGLYNDLKTI